MTTQRHLTWVAAVATILTALSLSPLFEEQAWLMPALLTVGLIAVVGYALRSFNLPFPVVAAAQVVAAALLLLYQFAPSGTLWFGLPTWDTVLALNDAGYAGRVTISRYSTPVPADDGVVLLTVAGIALVAVAVDLLAVGVRLVPLAGLPLLALYTVPVAVVPDGVPWLFFALAAGSYVGLLVAEGRERLTQWGRSMGFSERETEIHQFTGDVATGPIARVGRRIGAAAVCLAVAVPVVVPGLDQGLFGNGLGSGAGGGRTVITSDPVLDLRRDLLRPEDVPIFSYQTDDPTPDYWRMTTLDSFNGTQWERSDDRNIPDENVATDELPNAPGLESDVARQARVTDVQMEERFQSRWLPLPYPVTELAVEDGRWVYDSDTRNVFGVERDTAGLTYSVQSLELDFESVTAGDSVPSDIDEFLELPELPPLLGQLADQVTAGATTPYEKAAALQAWFRTPSEFRYTLEAPEGHSADDLVAFLEGREGYCEQFAATMALMARYLGIPARVDIGFLPGTQDTAATWAVTTHDAHAWPELYFEDLGWVRFEPTPAARTGVPPPWTVTAADPEPTVSATTSEGAVGQPSAAPTDREGLEGGADVVSGGGGFTFPTIPVLIGLGVVLLLLVPLLLRVSMTRARWRRATTPDGEVLAGWDVLRDRAADLGYAWSTADTPRSLAGTLRASADLQGAPAEAIDRLARGAERAMFARGVGDRRTGTSVRQDVDTVATALHDAVPRGRQWRARFLPASTRRVGHAISERVADALDWLEGLGEQARTSLRARRAPSGG